MGIHISKLFLAIEAVQKINPKQQPEFKYAYMDYDKSIIIPIDKPMENSVQIKYLKFIRTLDGNGWVLESTG